MLSISKDPHNTNILYLNGDTYPLRTYIKNWGGKWVPDRKCWKFSNITFDQLVSNLRSIDLSILKVDNKEHCIYHGLYSHHMINCPIEYHLFHSERYNFMSHEQGCSCNNGNTCLLCASACCKLAVIKQCVCILSTSCTEHGERCIGTHD
jgi:hypothetical protein